MITRTRLERAAALLPPALVFLAACSTWRPASPGVVPTGARVRVSLTPEGAAALTPTLGASVAAVEGEWGGEGGDSVVVRFARPLEADCALIWPPSTIAAPVR